MKENIGTFLEYVAMWHQLGIDYVEESDRKYETPFCQYFWVFFFFTDFIHFPDSSNTF